MDHMSILSSYFNPRTTDEGFRMSRDYEKSDPSRLTDLRRTVEPRDKVGSDIGLADVTSRSQIAHLQHGLVLSDLSNVSRI